jgi:hypothetical protein
MFDREATPEQEERQRLLENRAWLDENFERLQEKYAEQWVAVLGGAVVCNSKDVEVVKRAVEGKRGETVIIKIQAGSIPTPI